MSAEPRIAVVTGAGSGVGQAVAIRLAQDGWRTLILGRRDRALQETIDLAGVGTPNLKAYPCDVGDADQVADMARAILADHPHVPLLVNCAGTNMPSRKLDVLSAADFEQIVRTNLNGTFYCVRELLPSMRRHRSGTIVNVISDAGLLANAYAGAAYVASKFGQAGLTATINAEERQNGIRACGIFPGEIDTPILEKRPSVPTPEARARMLRPAADVAECVMLAISLPPHAIVEQLVVRPR